EPVNPATVTTATFTINPPVTGAITVTGTTAMFAPSTSLAPSTVYTGTLTTGIKDLAGNALATFSWTFTTSAGGTTSGTGLDFPGSAAVSTTMRFRFMNPQNIGLPIYGPGGVGVTYIWRAYPRQQSGYYTAFFWGNDNGGDNNTGFRWNNGLADTYYGAHPYPDTQPNGSTHQWEIAAESNDFVNGVVVYNRWYTQVLRVWADASGNKYHEFYWDWPNTDASHMVTHTSDNRWGNMNPPVPALTWGDAPWNPGAEVWNGILRGMQIYAIKLSLADIQSEITTPRFEGIARLLKPTGVITMEFPHLAQLMASNQFDTIYHEHFSYLSFCTVEKVFAAHGLTLFDVDELPSHGGSLRIYARHTQDTSRPISKKVLELRMREEIAGLTTLEPYASFSEQVQVTKRKLLTFLIDAKGAGKSIVGYGAPGKGNTLLNYCGIRTDFLEYVVDRSLAKQGKYTPGTHIPIYPVERIRETKPDYVLILPWNLKKEVMAQLNYIQEWGGAFVVPIPDVTVVRNVDQEIS
ncbi:MAG: hypothetical protein E8D47_08735, partial [Nitrospira sp.]